MKCERRMPSLMKLKGDMVPFQAGQAGGGRGLQG